MPRIISKIHTTSDFTKSFRKLPKPIQELAIRRDQWFRDDAFDPRRNARDL